MSPILTTKTKPLPISRNYLEEKKKASSSQKQSATLLPKSYQEDLPTNLMPENTFLQQDWIPHPYQKMAVQFLLKQCSAGLFLDPGLGKTSIALKALDILLKNKLIRRALVVPPLRPAYEVWPVQIDQWKQFSHLRWNILHGDNKDDAVNTDADVYIINPDGLPWFFANRTGQSPFNIIKPELLIIDESSKFKHTRTRRFKLLKPFLSRFQRRWILTGSPNPNGYMDLFGQIYILDLGKALGEYITHFRMNYFIPAGGSGPIVYNWRLKQGGEKAIQRAIKPLVLSLDENEYLKVPKEVPNIIRVALPPAARKIYDDLEDEMIAELEDRSVVTAVNAAVASMKCCQVASGGIYINELKNERINRISKLLHNAKTEALVDLVEELQGVPLLLGFEFDHDLERILTAFPRTPYIKGGVKPDDARRIIQQWNGNKLSLFACNVASVAHGLNLQEGQCQHVAFYTVPWDFENYDQFIRRVRRQGNKHGHVIVHHFIARDTVDESKLRAMRSKERTQRGLMQALRTYIKVRHQTP